jgi:hypothetical protein
MRGVLVLVLGVAISTPASAGFISGNELLQSCTSGGKNAEDYQNRAECRGYVQGVADELSATQKKFRECMDAKSGVTAGQTVDVVVKYLQDNPAKRNFTAASLATVALMEAFCE